MSSRLAIPLRPRLGLRWLALPVFTLLLGVTPMPVHAQPAPAPTPSAALAVDPAVAASPTVAAEPPPPLPEPPVSLFQALWPLTPRDDDPVFERKELAAIRAAMARKKHLDVCRLGSALVRERMAEAAKLFYAPVRKNADLDGISAFLGRWVHGKAPLLVLAGETFAVAPALRDVIAQACASAGRDLDAEAVLLTPAMIDGASRLRLALFVLRWRRVRELRRALWIIAGDPGAVPRWLRALAGGTAERKAAWDGPRAPLDPRDRGLLDQIRAYGASHPGVRP